MNPGRTKEELEKLKLAAEIRELDNQWYKKPVNALPILNTLLAVLAIIWGFKSGLLDTKAASLDLANKNLLWDIRQNIAKNDSIERKYKSLLDSVGRLNMSLKHMQDTLVIRNTREESLRNALLSTKSKDEQIQYYRRRLDSLVSISTKRTALNQLVPAQSSSYPNNSRDELYKRLDFVNTVGDELRVLDNQIATLESSLNNKNVSAEELRKRASSDLEGLIRTSGLIHSSVEILSRR